MLNRPLILVGILIGQALCALFFVGEIAMSVAGLPYAPLDWRLHELIEIGASIGLIGGVGLSAWALRLSLRRAKMAETALKRASSAFMDVVEERFTQWELTPAERDVALFALKGFNLAEIARIRQTSEGTVKAQTGSVYRKAGVSGRPQFLSLFVDDLITMPENENMAAPALSKGP